MDYTWDERRKKRLEQLKENPSMWQGIKEDVSPDQEVIEDEENKSPAETSEESEEPAESTPMPEMSDYEKELLERKKKRYQQIKGE